MRNQNRVAQLLGIEYPIIQGGMAWTSGYKLAAAVSQEGGLGVLAGGTFYPEELREEIRHTRKLTDKPFAVNIPLVMKTVEETMQVIIEERVPIVITSAGNPATWTARLKEEGIKVLHVVSSSKFAKKAETAGVDAVIAEGFEAGGHNGREETTTLCLIPAVRQAVQIPLIAAGGIASGAAIVACMALGAEGVQIGTAFALTEESACHQAFKEHCLALGEGDTKLMLKKLVPTRLAKGGFMDQVAEAEAKGATKEELATLLGKGRAKIGMSEGDLQEGELEIGQIASTINTLRPVREVMDQLVHDAKAILRDLSKVTL